MKVVFRVDAATWIGSGHLMRCLTLAEKLRGRGAEVSFICRELPGHMGCSVEEAGFALHLLPATDIKSAAVANENDRSAWLTVAAQVDAEQSRSIIAKLGGVAWLIVDHYGIDAEWESQLRAVAGSIMVIDDLANRRHDCDLLLDQNLLPAMEQRYCGLAPEQCLYLLGPRYALLRDEFINAAKARRMRNGSVGRVLLFMGGMDAANVTETAIRGLMLLPDRDISVDVVVGMSNPHQQQIAALCADDSRFTLHTQIDDMASRLNHTDLVIGAPGSSSWERALLGVPTVLVMLAENQRPIAKALQQRGAVIIAGDGETVTAQQIYQIVTELKQQPELLRSLSQAQLAVMADHDDGAAEVADLICNLSWNLSRDLNRGGGCDGKPH